MNYKTIKTLSNSFDTMQRTRHLLKCKNQIICHRVSDNNINFNPYLLDSPDYVWNFLPIINISLPYDTIKKILISVLWYHFLFNFDPNINCTLQFLCNCAKVPIALNFTTLYVIDINNCYIYIHRYAIVMQLDYIQSAFNTYVL